MLHFASDYRVDPAQSPHYHSFLVAENLQCFLSAVGQNPKADQRRFDHHDGNRPDHFGIENCWRINHPRSAVGLLGLFGCVAAVDCCSVDLGDVAAVAVEPVYAEQPFDSRLPTQPGLDCGTAFGAHLIAMGTLYSS